MRLPSKPTLTLAPAFALGLAGLGWAWPAAAEVLTYEAANKWVTAKDNAPLRALVAEVQRGSRQFSVRLPAQDRELAVARLVIVRDMLARETRQRGEGVLLEEVDGPPAAPNTLVIEAR